METFRTPISTIRGTFQLGLRDRVLTLGSCFSDLIGTRLQNHKIATEINPFGTVYNPMSLHKLLEYAITGNRPSSDTYLSRDQHYFNFDFHSSFVHMDRDGLEEKISRTLDDVAVSIRRCSTLIITYGTAFVYTHSGRLVNNCHKIPAAKFTRRLLNSAEMRDSFVMLKKLLDGVNKDLRIILTVSPVRHVKDTLEGNSVSKALLRMLCHELATAFPSVDYFPSFEIMMDDLRDYRFYGKDMIHPNEVAVDYIWEKFVDAYADENWKSFLSVWNEIIHALHHKPYLPGSKGHLNFLQQTRNKLLNLEKYTDVSAELSQVEQQIKHATP